MATDDESQDAQQDRLVDELRLSREALDELTDSANHLASEEYVKGLHDELAARQRRVFRVSIAASLTILAVFVLLVSLVIRLEESVSLNRELINSLFECTNPAETRQDPHECFTRQVRIEGMIEDLLIHEGLHVPPPVEP